jgi:hypothetical protein
MWDLSQPVLRGQTVSLWKQQNGLLFFKGKDFDVSFLPASLTFHLIVPTCQKKLILHILISKIFITIALGFINATGTLRKKL